METDRTRQVLGKVLFITPGRQPARANRSIWVRRPLMAGSAYSLRDEGLQNSKGSGLWQASGKVDAS